MPSQNLKTFVSNSLKIAGFLMRPSMEIAFYEKQYAFELLSILTFFAIQANLLRKVYFLLHKLSNYLTKSASNQTFPKDFIFICD